MNVIKMFMAMIKGLFSYGKFEDKESPEECLVREIKEEKAKKKATKAKTKKDTKA